MSLDPTRRESKGDFRSDNAKGCSQCGNKDHTKEKFWFVIGYPPWHPKAKKSPQKKNDKNQAYKGNSRDLIKVG